MRATMPLAGPSLLLALATSAAAAADRDVVPPVAETDIALAGAGSHTYRLALRAGEALLGEAVQHGIDVVVTVQGQDGRVLQEVDSPNGAEGPEPIALVVPRTGAYRISVRALEPAAPAGRYDLRISALHRATRHDRDVAAGLQEHLQAFAWRTEALRLKGLGQYERSRDLYARAARAAGEALRRRERALGADHPDVAATHAVLGYIDDETGAYARGEAHFARALQILEKSLGPGHPGVLTMETDLGYLRLAAGDAKGAVLLFTRSLARREELYGKEDPRLSSGLSGLGEALLELRELERAEGALRRGLALRGPAGNIAGMQTLLGAVLLAEGRVAEADEVCTRARADLEARSGANVTEVSSALLCLGEVRLTAGDPGAALPLLAEAERLRVSAVGPDHPAVAEVLTAEARALTRQGQQARAS